MCRTLLASIVLASLAAAAPQGPTTLVSRKANGSTGNAASGLPIVSSDGRYVVFESSADDLVPNDLNGKDDVFLFDRVSGATSLVSWTSTGAQANNHCGGWAISADDRLVVFSSYATNLVAGDTNGANDLFVRDLLLGTTTRVSLDSNGAQANGSVSSFHVGISADGRWLAFASLATNLVAGDTNAVSDVFLRDLQNGVTTRVSVSSAGVQGDGQSGDQSDVSISADGNLVVFSSAATNLVLGDTNGVEDVFVRDVSSGATKRVSQSLLGVEGDDASFGGWISADGGYIAFSSRAHNLVGVDSNPAVDAFRAELQTGQIVLLSQSSGGLQANNGTLATAISADGNIVGLDSIATNLVLGDTNGMDDAFVRDVASGATTRVSVASNGSQGAGSSFTSLMSISGDGRFVAFSSGFTNLVGGDSNHADDVFLHDRSQPPPTVYCTAKLNSQGCLPQVTFAGSASASSAQPFVIGAQSLINNKFGVLFYGFAPANAPFQDGTLCVALPLKRTAVQLSHGNPPPDDCSGSFAFDFNAYQQSGVDPFLVVGEVLFAQYWYRDPQLAVGPRTGLTDALTFTIQP